MNSKIKKLLIACSAAVMLSAPSMAMQPVTLVDQGSFLAGGTVITAPGKLDFNKPLDPAGQTLHGDHAYAFYQVPANARKNGIVFLHGAMSSGKAWETTPDGRDGFQNIFLEKGYRTYVVDQPRRGKAGQTTVKGEVSNTPTDQLWFDNFRMGVYPNYYKGTQAATDPASENQFFRSLTPNTGPYDPEVVANAMVAVFERVGDGVLVTHSQGGGTGWLTAMRSPHVKGVIALEPGSAFVFPEGEVPAAMESTSPFGNLSADGIKKEDFLKLTKIPILIMYGDYIPEANQETKNWNLDNWRVRLAMARLFAKEINKYGGDARVIYLPEIGIHGNTHFLMSDKNNEQIADLMEKWMEEKGLAAR